MKNLAVTLMHGANFLSLTMRKLALISYNNKEITPIRFHIAFYGKGIPFPLLRSIGCSGPQVSALAYSPHLTLKITYLQ